MGRCLLLRQHQDFAQLRGEVNIGRQGHPRQLITQAQPQNIGLLEAVGMQIEAAVIPAINNHPLFVGPDDAGRREGEVEPEQDQPLAAEVVAVELPLLREGVLELLVHGDDGAFADGHFFEQGALLPDEQLVFEEDPAAVRRNLPFVCPHILALVELESRFEGAGDGGRLGSAWLA